MEDAAHCPILGDARRRSVCIRNSPDSPGEFYQRRSAIMPQLNGSVLNMVVHVDRGGNCGMVRATFLLRALTRRRKRRGLNTSRLAAGRR